jgi:hypothetical protein
MSAKVLALERDLGSQASHPAEGSMSDYAAAYLRVYGPGVFRKLQAGPPGGGTRMA